MTKTQKKQIAYLDRMEIKEIDFGCWGMSFDVNCRDCGESYRFGTAENARKFVERHEDHKTWINTLR